MIVIIDYGMGNLKSVRNVFNFFGFDNKIFLDEEDIKNVKVLILLGVGVFLDVMDIIEKLYLDKIIKEEVRKGKFFFGICLGMQFLFEKSFEGIERKGLGFFKGSIVKMKNDKENNIKILYIGWNSLIYNKNDELISLIDEGNFVYYVYFYFV